MAKITRALISVSDKTGVVEFSKELAGYGVEILSTGGTAKLLREAGLTVKDVSEFTGFPEMLDGRVKTLHPKVHGGLLGMRSNPEHVAKMKEHGIENIDMVVVNLYPFEATVAKGCELEDAIENIDIGGPTMLRSAAKNYPDVTVLVDCADYALVLDEMKAAGGAVSSKTNFGLAVKVFQHTAAYDGAISNYLGARLGEAVESYPATFTIQVKKAQDLRYGENPQQSAAFYVDRDISEPCVSNAVQLQGKELSFNNIIDLDAAIETVKEFEASAAVIIKHTNPCGAALAESPLSAYLKARECDPVSAFGGIVGFNREVDADTAKELTSTFLEAVIAPGYSQEALDIFTAKKNVRVMQVPLLGEYCPGGYDLKKVVGGLLVQGRDLGMVRAAECRVVTERTPTASEYEALDFAWRVCKHVKSNAIVFTSRDQTVGIGAGQMSRVDSSRIAVQKALLPTRGTVLASDAFFPFRDGVDAAAEAGVTAIIQPGGSVRDEEVIKAANEHGIAMVFTGMRHFRH
ncbi:bifunctional phosphoribosylaminoimidazolecarboxamide formyltransferase/IMP cyclohydrolase [Geobacter sp. SVR]|uniref:bifunctional phosphoribosylaminoimidazolecarboxamide formyltransferase/IMP cyclohydrolase n=1 Tax=Geobacter sp. SVR TaxID=2495594 RepID=UPI00143EF746|nr:bifunctional phosphoribosylaminoimidazolecarboxamide formyltransferase/IMP cyclohydrolase [Geobacter sp. SVR]BCS55098.1 bifunctional purine biosynthesis protein PurH [Geobacter sp. SVR]GCF85279.1 bifunctional purine biosynthesis protein PurH [Geobacter sp. SVR]